MSWRRKQPQGTEVATAPEPAPRGDYEIRVKLGRDGERMEWRVYDVGGKQLAHGITATIYIHGTAEKAHSAAVTQAREWIKGEIDKELIRAKYNGEYSEWYGQKPSAMKAEVDRAVKVAAASADLLTEAEAAIASLEARLLDAGQLPHLPLTEAQLTA